MADSKRTTVITFRGTVAEFETFLEGWGAAPFSDWELTACIARHPAGKGLRPADPAPRMGDQPAETHVFEVGEMLCRLCEQPIGSPLHVRHREGDRCLCPPHEYAVAGHRASCPLGGAG